MKEFKTIAEQISILESRGMRFGEDASAALLRENYYSVINGYKDPFLDKEAMRSSPDDVFIEGCRFDWVFSLFQFDRELRQITFSYLIRAEAALKTATVYAFCEKHRGCSDYLDRASFCSAKDILVSKAFKGSKELVHSQSLNMLMGVLNKKLVVGSATRPFVEHYITSYNEVPLWVLSNDLTFGNMSHFFQLMKRGDQNSVCKNLFKTTLRGNDDKRITPHEVLRAYDVLTHFRNLCAHDERLYCAKVGNDGYATMLKLLEVALPSKEVTDMRNHIASLLGKYDDSLHVVTACDLKRQLGI